MRIINYLVALLMVIPLLSFKYNKKQNEKDVIDIEAEYAIKNLTEKAEIEKFSWGNIKETTSDIGTFPYIQAPKGTKVYDNRETKSYDYNRFEMFDGQSFFKMEGRVQTMYIVKEDGKDWNQFLFDKSVDEYLNSIGAQQIAFGKIPEELMQQKREEYNDKAWSSKYLVGNPSNDPLKFYILKTATKKIGFIIHSNNACASIGIIEDSDFVQTIEKTETFPYIHPPKGTKVYDNRETKSYDYNRFEMFDGQSFFKMEGRVQTMYIVKEDGKDWNQFLFDKSVDEYLNSIGAQQIAFGKIPEELMQQKREEYNDKAWSSKYLVGNPSNDPLKFYILKTATKKIGFIIHSNNACASIGIIEENTEVTADKILDDINTNDYATLYINFDTGKSSIKPESNNIIKEVAKMMKANKELKINIEGHTDNVGDEASNMKLSKNRAKSVLIAITNEGIDESRLKFEGFGQSKPIGDNTTEEGKAKNRRVELRKF
jgi:outer membrane protein OmpA-like peptidoglycan-associated protein